MHKNIVFLLSKAIQLIDTDEDIDGGLLILENLKKDFDKQYKNNHLRDEDKEIWFDIFLLLADCLRLKNEYQKALSLAHDAFCLNKSSTKARLNLATAHFDMGDLVKGICLLGPLSRNQDEADFYNLYGQILCALEEFKMADEAFLKAHEINQKIYPKPIRFKHEQFEKLVRKAITHLPKGISDFFGKCHIQILNILPKEIIENNLGKITPKNFTYFYHNEDKIYIIIAQKNIENILTKKSQAEETIASCLIHIQTQINL